MAEFPKSVAASDDMLRESLQIESHNISIDSCPFSTPSLRPG